MNSKITPYAARSPTMPMRMPMAKGAANAVAARLAAAGEALTADFEGYLGRVLAELGVIEAERGAPAGWRRLVPRPPFDCAAVDPEFLPDAVAIAAPGGTIRLAFDANDPARAWGSPNGLWILRIL